jgi:hypothetical protein
MTEQEIKEIRVRLNFLELEFKMLRDSNQFHTKLLTVIVSLLFGIFVGMHILWVL